MKAQVILFIALLLFLLSVNPDNLPAKVKNQYSYLPKPPITIKTIIEPDKEIYERGEIINFDVYVILDTLKSDPLCNYYLYFGNLNDLLTQSKLIDSDVLDRYTLNRKDNLILISFKVKMLNKYSPPFIEVSAVREAPGYAAAKKQFLNIIIDEYAAYYLTSPAYAKARSSSYGSTDY